MAGSLVVPIEKVIAHKDAPRLFVRRMVTVLERQGQIEPLQVRTYAPDTYITFEQDPWGVEIVLAAQILGWPTLLVLPTEKFQK